MTTRASTTVRYETHTTIDRPAGEVFARLADLDGYRTWMHRTGLFRRSGQTSDGPRGPGTAYFDATRMGTFRGRGNRLRAEVADRIPRDPSVVRPRADGGAAGVPPRGGPDKTIVHHIAEGELFGMMRLMKPVAALMARSERTRTVKSLRRSLESDPLPTDPTRARSRTSITTPSRAV